MLTKKIGHGSSECVADRAIAPPIKEEFKITFDTPVIRTLEDNLTFYWMKNVLNETSRIDLYFDAGSGFTQPIIASITAAMLLSGSDKKSSQKIHEQLDFFGAYYDVEVTQHHCIVHLYALKENIAQVTSTFVEALMDMNCLANELKLIIDEKRQKFAINLQRVSAVAQRNFQQLVFNGTPMKRIIQSRDFSKITTENIRQFHQNNYLNGLSRIHVVGDVDVNSISRITDLLKPLASKNKKSKPLRFENLKTSIHLPKKNALQSAIRIGKICINKHHEDYIGFSILCTILGDYFGSRLMKNIREDKGYTYGIGCMIQELPETGIFLIVTEVGVDQRELALQEIKKEIEILQTELVPKTELNLVKNYLLGQALKAADGPYAQFDLFLGVDMFGLGVNYYDKYLTELKKIKAIELRELAKKHLNWDDFTIVTVG